MEPSIKFAVGTSVTYCTAIWYFIKKSQGEHNRVSIDMVSMTMAAGVFTAGAAGIFTAGAMLCGYTKKTTRANNYLLSGIMASTALWCDLLS